MARHTTGKAGTLSDTDFKKLLKNVGVDNHSERNTTILLMTHYLALRSKEIASLKIEDVYDPNNGIKETLRLIATYTKGKKHRDIPLTNKKIVEALKEWIDYRKDKDGLSFNLGSPLFKSQKNQKFSPNSMTRMIGNIYKSNGFPNCSSHTGRRSMITKLANSGIDLNSIRILAGHSSISTTQIYVEENPDMLAKIMKEL